MELVVVPFVLADVAGTAASREVRVSHVGAGLERGLELGEDVVLHCADGEFLAARVTGFDFELEDTLYRLEPGVRLPLRDAAVRLGVEEGDLRDRGRAVTVQDVLDLLGEVRRSRTHRDPLA
jgi:hypothetical protein